MIGPSHKVEVTGLPNWIDARRFLGASGWSHEGDAWTATLSPVEAADVAARLRGIGLGGALLSVHVDPPLPRELVRQARAEDARRRRDTTPGFNRPGARVDDEGRWSLTPEPLAVALGEQLWERGARTIVDAGCGAGGNTIGFARAGCRVIAIDQDRRRLADAAANCRLYGVADRVRFFHGDATEAWTHKADLVFCDPPWGTDWDRARTTTDDLPLLSALLAARGARTLVAKLPPSFYASDCSFRAWFGRADGDWRRVKFITARWSGPATR